MTVKMFYGRVSSAGQNAARQTEEAERLGIDERYVFVFDVQTVFHVLDLVFHADDLLPEGVCGGGLCLWFQTAEGIYRCADDLEDHQHIIKRGGFGSTGEEFIDGRNGNAGFAADILIGQAGCIHGFYQCVHINKGIGVSGGEDNGVFVKNDVFVLMVGGIIRQDHQVGFVFHGNLPYVI